MCFLLCGCGLESYFPSGRFCHGAFGSPNSVIAKSGSREISPSSNLHSWRNGKQAAKEILANGSTTTLTVFSGSPWHRKVHCFFPSDLVPGLEPFSWFSYLLTTRRRHRRVNQCLCHDTQRKCWIHQNPFQSRHWIWQHKEKSKYATKVSLWTSNSERDESDNGRRYARESDVSVNRQAWMVWEITVFSSWESNFTSTAAKSRTDNEEKETMNPLTWLLSTPTLAPMEKVFYLINFESDKLGVFVFSIDQKKTPVVLCRVLTFLVRGCVWLFRMWVLD